MTDEQAAQAALPEGFDDDIAAWIEVNSDAEVSNAMIHMFLAGVKYAREKDSQGHRFNLDDYYP